MAGQGRDYLLSDTPHQKWQAIYAEEAARERVTVAMMLGTGRQRPIVQARHRAWLRMQQELGLGVTEIGRVADRHWTTVMHGVALAGQELRAA